MPSRPYLTSNDLIETVKLNCSFPIAQNTFSNEDILKFANHELFMSQVPSVLIYHEDYFSYREQITLIANKSRYDIPYRAIGNKVYDVYYKSDSLVNDDLRKLSFVDAADKAFFQSNKGSLSTPYHFYIESNQIVLCPDIGESVSGSLVIVYYLRPNNLVVDERAAICIGFSKDITIDNTTLVAGNKVTIGDITLTADTDFAIGLTSIATATNLNNKINTLEDYTSSISSNIITVNYELLKTPITTSNSLAFSIETTQTVVFDQVPSNITNSSKIDFLKKKGGHRTYSFDIKLGKTAVSANSIKFKSTDIPEDFEVEDYVCSQYESIIPQIPSDLHSLLAERTVARIMESLGDQAGLQNANDKIKEMEARQGSMMDNRVEGSPRKIFNRNSLLRYGKGIGYGRTKI